MPKPLMLSAAVKRAIYIVSPAQGIKPNIAGLIQGISPFSAEDCFHFFKPLCPDTRRITLDDFGNLPLRQTNYPANGVFVMGGGYVPAIADHLLKHDRYDLQKLSPIAEGIRAAILSPKYDYRFIGICAGGALAVNAFTLYDTTVGKRTTFSSAEWSIGLLSATAVGALRYGIVVPLFWTVI